MIVWLIGYMGSGKTTVAAQLAKAANLAVMDTDETIEQQTKLSISQLFTKHGQSYFRVLERQLCLTMSTASSVVATGGGLPIHSYSIDEMKQVGKVVYLRMPIDDLWQRVRDDDTHRPLAHDKSTFVAIYEERRAVYETADVIVEDYRDWDVEQWMRFLKELN